MTEKLPVKCCCNAMKLDGKFSIWNPFFVYILGFSIPLLVYQLGWSNLFPKISFGLVLFLVLTFSYSFFAGFYVYRKKIIAYQDISYDENIILIAIFIIMGYFLEILYAGNIPLLAILSGKECDYKTFGIKSFHVLLITFSNFYTVYIFHVYLSTRKTKCLVIAILLLGMLLLIYNRGTFLLNISSCLFVYLLSIRKLHLKFTVILVLLAIPLLYLFGIAGNVRVMREAGRTEHVTSSDIILKTGNAKDSFRDSIIPKEYFWAYLYISSPLANLQKTITDSEPADLTFSRLLSFINFEILPDFISKRISRFLEIKKIQINQITPAMTVGTVYGYSYAYLNWLGLALMFSYTMLASFTYLILLKKNSTFFITGIAILNTLILFNIFSNMFSFSGISFQLVYPLVFSFFRKKTEREDICLHGLL
jgi:hypothetical protein